MNIQPVYDDFGNLTHFVAIEHDITEKREFQQRLIERDERIRAIAERTTEGIAVLDGTGTVVYVNPSYARITGYPADEIVGISTTEIFERVHPDDAVFLHERIYGAIDAGVTGMIYRFRFRDPVGGYVWREDSVTCFYNNNGSLEQSYVFMRDISDLHPKNPTFAVMK